MDRIVEEFVSWSGALVPLMTIWAITLLYTQKTGQDSTASHALYIFALLLVASATMRTIVVNDGCWLVHTASLATMILAGVLRRPEAQFDNGFGMTHAISVDPY